MEIETTFLLGAAGAAAPEILRLYELRSNPERFKWAWALLFLTIPFLLFGGLVAVILPTSPAVRWSLHGSVAAGDHFGGGDEG